MSPMKLQYQIDKYRQADLQRNADQYRLARIAQGESRRTRYVRMARIYKPTLFRLGERLVSIGTSLQIRYGDLKPSPSER